MKIRDMVLISLFTALTAIGGFISIPLGPVSITLQSIFVVFSGIILGPNLAATSQILYIGLGLAGLPIFAGYTGGLQAIFKPSFGFLIGFIFSSYFSGLIYEGYKKRARVNLWLISILANMIIYLFGIPYMYYALNILGGMDVSLSFVLKFGLLVFIPGDIIKISLSSLIGKRLLTLRK